jgi:hypothetical protein
MPFKTQGSFRVDRSVVSSSRVSKSGPLALGLTTEENDLNAGLNWHKVTESFGLLFLNAYKNPISSTVAT